MQAEDVGYLERNLAAGLRGTGKKRRENIDEEGVAEVAKRQLDVAAAEGLLRARAEEEAAAAARLAALRDMPPEMEIESTPSTSTRMAGRGRRSDLRNRTPAEIEELKRLRALAAAQKKEEAQRRGQIRREKNQAKKLEREQAILRGEEVEEIPKKKRGPAYFEAIPQKKRPAAPAVEESTGREVVPMPKRPRRQVVPVGFAQRLAYQLQKKIAGLAGQWIRLKNHPTHNEKYTHVRGGRTLGQARLQAVENRLADLRWELEQDGFADYILKLPFNPAHYKALPKAKLSQAQLDVFGSKVGMKLPLSIVHHYAGEAYPK